MTSSPPAGAGRRALVARIRRAAPGLLVLLVLVVASLAPVSSDSTTLTLASPDRSHVNQLRGAFGALPADALVLVGFDADLGTYPEIRSVVRAALDDLLARGARLAFVSFTPEGRAIAAAELDRLARAGGAKSAQAPADLGFMAGAEAGLVRSVASVVPAGAGGPVAEAIRARGGGLGAFDMVLVVSGSDLSARSWVEQVRPRVTQLPMVAIAPSFLDPELEPYLRSGQLVAVLATLRDGTAYAETVADGSTASSRAPIRVLPMLLGMLIAIGVMAEAAFRQVTSRVAGQRIGGRAP
jgi:hypothetical protein